MFSVLHIESILPIHNQFLLFNQGQFSCAVIQQNPSSPHRSDLKFHHTETIFNSCNKRHKRDQSDQVSNRSMQRPELETCKDLLNCISMRLQLFRNSYILPISGISLFIPSQKRNIWETTDKLFSFAQIRFWQNLMSSILSIDILIKSTERASNVTQGRKKKGKTPKLQLFQNTESCKFSFSVIENYLRHQVMTMDKYLDKYYRY